MVHKIVALMLALAVVGAVRTVQGYDGEGQAKVFWQNEPAREFAAWFLRQSTVVSSGKITNDIGAGWRIVATADFNRDGEPDLLWRSAATGDNEIWLMRGNERLARHPITPNTSSFKIAGAGDFNGDGYPDILWRDAEFNLTAVWFMEGTNWTGRWAWVSLNENEFTWDLVATGDFNNDGYSDIVWRDRYSGRNVIWLLNGTELLESVDIRPEPDLGYQIVGTGGFNAFGNTDLLWRYVNGDNLIWLMKGTEYSATATLPYEIDNDWQIAGAGGSTNAMVLSAVPQNGSQGLTLVWRYGASQRPTIERRQVGARSWDLLATNYVPMRLTNSDLTIGQRYEYRVAGEYLMGGVAAAPIEDRGKIILVVEDGLAKQMEPELELLKADLVGDGWSVIRTNVPRHDDAIWSKNLAAIASIKSFITNSYNQEPTRTKAVYLIGHVPIPYSGFANPDGHGSRALPADIYYGDVDGIYTDFLWDFPSFLVGTRYLRHDNFSGDGKFDQSHVPDNPKGIGELELAVGRIDFSDLPSFGGLSEAELTRRYLQKARRYRQKQTVLPDRVGVWATFPFVGKSREACNEALKIGSRLFGTKPGSVFEGDPFDRKNSALWGILGGSGLEFAILGQNRSYHLASQMPHVDSEPKLAFANVCASLCLDFHYTDNFLRAFIASPNYGLGIMWFRPFTPDGIPLAFESLSLGETIGAGFVRSINESQRNTGENIYIALLGDPTLRVQVLAPPTGLRTESASDRTIVWSAAAETNANYFVYRSMNGLDGPWIRLTSNAISQTTFTDSAAPVGPKLYQVRTAKLITTGSGSFTNLSQGVFLNVE